MNQTLIAIILGMIEGVTEFLPISSSGHLILMNYLLNIDSLNIKNLAIMIQIGPVLSLLLIFRNTLRKKIYCLLINFNKEKKKLYKLFLCCVAGLLPVFIIGIYCFHDIQKIYSPMHIVINLIIGSIIFIIAERLQSDTKKITNIYTISYFQALIIGCAQCLSVLPGISRLGITISTGLILGFTRKVALEFSLMLFFFISCGTFIIDIYKNFSCFIINHDLIIVSILTSFFVSFFLGNFLISIMYRASLIFFATYRLLLAYIIFIFINH